jgi:hypothetical protein
MYRTLEDLIEQRAKALCTAAGMRSDEITEWTDQGMEGRREKCKRWTLFISQVEEDIAAALKLGRCELWV